MLLYSAYCLIQYQPILSSVSMNICFLVIALRRLKFFFSQFKSVFRFINVWQTCFQTMLKRRIFTWSTEILGLFCKHLFGSSIDWTWRLHSGRTLYSMYRNPSMFDFTFSILSLLSLFSSALFYPDISFNQEMLHP